MTKSTKKLILSALFYVGLQTIISAQNFDNKYGLVGKEDLLISNYANDKSAEAVVLYDIGKSYFTRVGDSFEVIYERTTRIKMFKEAGVKWGIVEIPYYRKDNIFENVFDIEACTYNFENGVVIKTELDLKNSHDEKLNESWYLKKLALPNVKEGSIVEYRYKIKSEFVFNLRDWEFQSKIPVIYSEYEVRMIPFYNYVWILQGAYKFDSQTSYVDQGISSQYGPVTYQDMIHKYIMKDIPAFKDEEYISSINDYIIKIDFQLSIVNQIDGTSRKILTSWPELVKDLIKDEDFGVYIKKSEKIAPKLLNLEVLKLKTPIERFDSIIQYVKSNFSWNKMNGKYASKSPKAFLNDKFGNVADINLFVVGLLNAVNIKATPVILSTRDNGKTKSNYPYTHFFNYVLISAEVDGKVIFTDATEALASNQRIPEKCINDKGLMIEKDKEEWVNLQSGTPSKILKIFKISLTDSTQNTIIETSATEYDALDFRTDLGENIETIQKNLFQKGYSVMDSTIKVKNQTNIKEPYILKYSVSANPEVINDKIYISPFLHEIDNENPLKQLVRINPIDMIYPTKRIFFTEINIPQGYKVDFLPESNKIKNDLFELDYNIISDESKISVSYNYYFRNSVYQAADYLKVKFYFNEIINKGSEKIVLVRK